MNIEALVNKYYKQLNENDMAVLNYIMQHKAECSGMNIMELSKRCSFSTTSIIRTTKKLGFTGYSEFKYALKNQTQTNQSADKTVDWIGMLENDIQATVKLMKQIDLNPILSLIYRSKRVYGFGTGYRQQHALNLFAHNMVSCDKQVFIIPAKQELETQVSFMKKDDLIIIASYSGDIKEYIQSIHALNLLEVPIISITSFSKNELSSFTPYNLYYQTTSLTPEHRPRRTMYETLDIAQGILFREYLRFWLEFMGADTE